MSGSEPFCQLKEIHESIRSRKVITGCSHAVHRNTRFRDVHMLNLRDSCLAQDALFAPVWLPRPCPQADPIASLGHTLWCRAHRLKLFPSLYERGKFWFEETDENGGTPAGSISAPTRWTLTHAKTFIRVRVPSSRAPLAHRIVWILIFSSPLGIGKWWGSGVITSFASETWAGMEIAAARFNAAWNSTYTASLFAHFERPFSFAATFSVDSSDDASTTAS